MGDPTKSPPVGGAPLAPLPAIRNLRRLPVYFLLDCSAHMGGQLNVAMLEGLDNVRNVLSRQQWSARHAYLSATSLQERAAALHEPQLPWLEPVRHFQPPLTLDAGGDTSLAPALRSLAAALHYDTIDPTPQHPGDLDALVFLVLGDIPNDERDWQQALAYLHRAGARHTPKLIVLQMRIDLSAALRPFGCTLLRLHTARAESLSNFFAWATQLIALECDAYVSGNAVMELPPFPYGVEPQPQP